VRPSARVRALHDQHEELPLLSHARPVLAAGTASVIQGGVRWCDPTDRDNWMMIADTLGDWGERDVDMDGRGQHFVACAASDETAIERGRALSQTLIHV